MRDAVVAANATNSVTEEGHLHPESRQPGWLRWRPVAVYFPPFFRRPMAWSDDTEATVGHGCCIGQPQPYAMDGS